MAGVRGVPVGRHVLCDCFNGNDRGCNGVCEHSVDHVAKAIQEAVQAERERCAGVADRIEIMNTQKQPRRGEWWTFAIVRAKIKTARDIAADIRDQGSEKQNNGE